MIYSILVIEDRQTIRHFVGEALRDQGYRVLEEGTLREGLHAFSAQQPALVLLDLGLPDGDGTEFIATVRTFSQKPIVVLSARGDRTSKVRALDLGADDFIAKPFSMKELIARVRAHLRRSSQDRGELQTLVQKIGNVTVDLEKRLVYKNGEMVHLTKIEYRLLTTLLQQRGKVVMQRYLLQQVWGANYVDRPHYLRVYMKALRDKLEDDPANPVYFVTETGVGYRLTWGEDEKADF